MSSVQANHTACCMSCRHRVKAKILSLPLGLDGRPSWRTRTERKAKRLDATDFRHRSFLITVGRNRRRESLSSWDPLRPELLEKLKPSGCDANGGPAVPALGANQAAVVGILPDRKPGTGGAPGIHRFFVSSLFAGKPLQEIKDQRFNRLGHGVILSAFANDQQRMSGDMLGFHSAQSRSFGDVNDCITHCLHI